MQVYFVQNHHQRHLAVRNFAVQTFVAERAFAQFHHVQQHVGVLKNPLNGLQHGFLQGVLGLQNPGGVRQHQLVGRSRGSRARHRFGLLFTGVDSRIRSQNAVQDAKDAVPGGLRFGRYNAQTFAQQGVRKRALPYVGVTN